MDSFRHKLFIEVPFRNDFVKNPIAFADISLVISFGSFFDSFIVFAQSLFDGTFIGCLILISVLEFFDSTCITIDYGFVELDGFLLFLSGYAAYECAPAEKSIPLSKTISMVSRVAIWVLHS